jgi:hypothetical protein
LYTFLSSSMPIDIWEWVKIMKSRGSSVSIVSGYRLDYRTIEVRSPTEAKDFSSNLCVQTGSGAHPTYCRMGTGDIFRGGKAWPGRDADHSPHAVPRSWMSRSYTSSPSCACIGVLCGCLFYKLWSSSVCNFLNSSLTFVKIFSLGPCSQTPSVYALLLMWDTKFYTHTKRLAELWFCTF